MKRTLKKSLAMLLALCMVMSVTVFANDPAEEPGFDNQVGKYLEYSFDGIAADEPALEAEESVKSIEDGKVTLSKTIEQTGKDAFDITLQVTTTEDLEVIKKARDAAIVIVMDVSGSMQFAMDGGGYCATCGTNKYYEDAYKCCHGGWVNAWGNPTIKDQNDVNHGDTRFALMENAVSAFLEEFADNSGSNAKRMVSMVCYNDEVKKELGWVNVTEAEGMAAAKAVVDEGALAALTGANTNTALGLQRANEYLDEAAIEGIDNTYVLLLTDGAPYTAIQYNADGTYNPRVSGVGYDCDLTQVAANKLKGDHENTEVYTVCFGYQGKEWTATHSIVDGVLTGTDKKFNIDELMASIASEGCFFRGEDVDEFELSLGSIVEETISHGAKLWTVTDPMGDNILYQGKHEGDVFTFADNTLTWDLLAENPVSDENGVYTYTLTYPITLDTEAEGFEFDTQYPANKATSLKYALTEDGKIVENGIKTDYFNVPTVFATENKDFTVTFEPGDASNISFMLIDEDGNVEFREKIDIGGETSFEIPTEEGKISAVFVKQSTSGMFWFSEAVGADVIAATIECLKDNNPSYKGYNALCYGAGDHDLEFKNNKFVTYTFTGGKEGGNLEYAETVEVVEETSKNNKKNKKNKK